jgi:hypothetical protein
VPEEDGSAGAGGRDGEVLRGLTRQCGSGVAT